jgi:hypothetical protein
MANIFRWQVLDGWISIKTSHSSSQLSAGISRCACKYAICMTIAQQSVSQNRSANTRSCMSWILFYPPLSYLGYWLHPKIYIVQTEHKLHSRMVGRWGRSNSRPELPFGFLLWDWAWDPG